MPHHEELFPSVEFTIRDSKLRFENLAKLTAFWLAEREAFNAILQNTQANHTNPSANLIQIIINHQNAVDAQINEVRQILQGHGPSISEPQRAALSAQMKRCADNITVAIQTAFSDAPHGLWLSTEPNAKFILRLAKTNRDEAAFAFLSLRGLDFNSSSHWAISGTIKAHFFKQNISSARSEAEAASLHAITTNWKIEADKMIRDAETIRNESKSLNDDHKKAISLEAAAAANRADDAKKFLIEKEAEAQNYFAKSQLELEKLIAVYDQHMKLKAPVEYWRLKKERHVRGRSWLIAGTILIGGGSFAGLGWYVWNNFHEGPTGVVPWREILGFFVLSSVVFWVVKIFVRLLLSSIHLAEDAAEREVMAMTYMAMARGDGTTTTYLEEKDRALVLAPLFRPSSTGVIDDGAPPHISEIITKIGR